MGVYVSLEIQFHFLWLYTKKWACWIIVVLFLIWEISKLFIMIFHSDCYQFTFPGTMHKVCFSPHCREYLSYFLLIIDVLAGVWWSQWFSIHISLMISEVEYLFMYCWAFVFLWGMFICDPLPFLKILGYLVFSYELNCIRSLFWILTFKTDIDRRLREPGHKHLGVWMCGCLGPLGTCSWQLGGLMQVQNLNSLLGKDDPALKSWGSFLTLLMELGVSGWVWLIQACRTLLTSQGGVFHSWSYPWWKSWHIVSTPVSAYWPKEIGLKKKRM